MPVRSELTFCPICGHKLVWKTEGGRQRRACENCGYIHYVNPVPAVGILIEMDGGVVLIRRSNPPHKDEWTLPSGYIEADESAEEGAIREAEEETGLKVKILGLASVNSFPEGPPSSGIMIFFRAVPIGGTLQAGDDASEARVFQPEEIPLLPFRTHREMIAQWLELKGQQGQTEVSPESQLVFKETNFTIRPYENTDSQEIFGLLALIPANRQSTAESRQEILWRLRESNDLEIFVAEANQSPPILIGFITLSVVRTLTEGIGMIHDMAVLPTYQRRGIGAELLEAVLRRAERLNLRRIMVHSERASESARAFYATLGFSDVQGLMELKLKK